MARQLTSGAETLLEGVRRLVSEPVTPEALAARRAAVDSIRRLRAEMPPVDPTVDELLVDDDGEGD